MRLVVLGDPVAHSRSPAIHTAALEAARLAGTYTARRVDADGLRRAVDEIRAGALDGANVTMPHKRLAAELADRLEPAAARGRVVNTLVRVGGDVVGHNTDIAGVRDAWTRMGLPPRGPVLVLGTGGAAAAALLALEGRDLVVEGRSRDKAEMLCSALGIAAGIERFGKAVEGAAVVNATPLGMNGEAWPEAVLGAASAVFDMAYGAGPTPAVAHARARGIPVADGLEMLVAQAAESFRLWIGRAPDIEVMHRAVREMRTPSGDHT